MGVKTSGYRFTRSLLASIKRRIREVLGPEDPEILEYYAPYKKELRSARALPSSREHFVAEASRRWVTLVGDFHTLEHAQKTYLHLLEDLAASKVRPIVVLEMAEARHDVALHRFVRGGIEEGEFLEAIDYFHRWGFNFLHYRPLFDHARERRLAVHGLNRQGPLVSRDRYMAYRIRHLCAAYPNQPLLVLVGDLHLASGHLPAELQKQGIAPLLLFQNSETLYMRRLRRGEEPTGWFYLGKDRYLVNNTPPTVKMQTFLTWLEHGGEALCAMYGFCGRDVDPEGEVELSDTVQRYIRALHDLFGLRHKSDDDFQVFTFNSLGFLNDSYYRKPPGSWLAALVKDGYSVYSPHERTIYVPMMDLNRTVEEAMHYLMDAELPTGPSLRAFLERAHYFASGFLASKLVNPSRHAPDEAEMRRKVKEIQALPPGKQKRKLERLKGALEGCLRYLDMRRRQGRWEASELEAVTRTDFQTLFGVSRHLGYLLGQKLYEAYDRGEVSAGGLRRYAFQQRDPFYLVEEGP